MIEEDAVAGKKVVTLPVVLGDPIGIHLCRTVGRPRIERGLLILGRGACPKHFGT